MHNYTFAFFLLLHTHGEVPTESWVTWQSLLWSCSLQSFQSRTYVTFEKSRWYHKCEGGVAYCQQWDHCFKVFKQILQQYSTTTCCCCWFLATILSLSSSVKYAGQQLIETRFLLLTRCDSYLCTNLHQLATTTTKWLCYWENVLHCTRMGLFKVFTTFRKIEFCSITSITDLTVYFVSLHFTLLYLYYRYLWT